MIRCVYSDLDGTLLGSGGSLFRDAEGRFSLLAARALEACFRADVEVVLKSGRRKAQVDAVFAKAAKVSKIALTNNRLIPNALEPRAAIGSYNRANDEYTLYVANQNPHVERLLMTAFVLGLPEHKVRVIAPDVGGGFGSKLNTLPEDFIVPLMAIVTGRPVKWIGAGRRTCKIPCTAVTWSITSR